MYKTIEQLRDECYFSYESFGSIAPSNVDEIFAAANSLIDEIIDNRSEDADPTDPEFWEDIKRESDRLWEKYCMDDEINGVKSEWGDNE